MHLPSKLRRSDVTDGLAEYLPSNVTDRLTGSLDNKMKWCSDGSWRAECDGDEDGSSSFILSERGGECPEGVVLR
jgi:hypothetical protein